MRNSVKRLSTLWPFVFLTACIVGRVDAQILKCVSSSGAAYYTQVTCPPGTTPASAQPSSTDGTSFGIKRIFLGSFSGKQIGGPGKLSTETLKIRVASKGAGYVFSIWDKETWNDLPFKVIPCNVADFFGTRSSESKAVSGACLEGAKSALFYTPNHNLKDLGGQLNTDFLLLLAAPFGGTVWEMTKN